MEEIWKDIQGYEGYYQVSNLGNIKSLARKIIRSDGVVQFRKERIMSKRICTDGYYMAKFNVDKKSECIAIHKLVAKHFIPNPNNLPEVNHKDCNRKNNCIDNLEWCTHQENVKYSWELGHYKGRFGKDNPNYGNDTLKRKYAENPELAKVLLARHGKQNGRCVPIRVTTKNEVKDFDYIGEVAEYLIANNFTNAKIDTIRNNITQAIKQNRKYLNCIFERI